MATDLLTLWQNIAAAGGTGNWANQQLRERGFVVERKDTESMGEAEKARYKASLKEEAAQIRKWAAENGYEVSSRGRLHRDVVEAYRNAKRK